MTSAHIEFAYSISNNYLLWCLIDISSFVNPISLLAMRAASRSLGLIQHCYDCVYCHVCVCVFTFAGLLVLKNHQSEASGTLAGSRVAEAGLPPRPPDFRPLVPSSSLHCPFYRAGFPSLSCFSLLGYKPSAVFPRVVFWNLREILLECPVPSPSKFPALFNCSREIPALLGGAQKAVKSIGQKW